MAGDELFKIRGILNGTCTTFHQIEAPASFATLWQAQKLGFSRSRSDEDIDGLDARPNPRSCAVGLHAMSTGSIVARRSQRSTLI